jgi:hypothetical protein
VGIGSRCSGNLLPPSPPAEKATARQDQTGKASTNDGAVSGELSGLGQGFRRAETFTVGVAGTLTLRLWVTAPLFPSSPVSHEILKPVDCLSKAKWFGTPQPLVRAGLPQRSSGKLSLRKGTIGALRVGGVDRK